MMKNVHSWCKTPPSVSVQIKHDTLRSLQVRRGLQLKRTNGQEVKGPAGKSQLRCYEGYHQSKPALQSKTNLSNSPQVIQREEMVAFLKIFDDDLVKDFLWKDSCFKVSDKYLLAMTFIYFRRANFSISEHNRMNFFVALYLANTMEEDEEETKYEIFPWALGQTWRKRFPDFLKQRDMLWTRIGYRAAVSRRCCEEVMAIMPSHFVWHRERAKHHSGAQRRYGVQDQVCVPRGPLASPDTCILCDCKRKTKLSYSSGSSSPLPSPGSLLPFAISLSMQITPPRIKASRRKVHLGKGKGPTQHPSRRYPQEAARSSSSCGSTYDPSMDWFNEE